MQENERKAEAAELRRRTQVQVNEDESSTTDTTVNGASSSADMASTVTESVRTEGDTPPIPKLQLNTETLGSQPSSNEKSTQEQNEEAVPDSAVTTDSFDDQVTTIDPEPQLDVVARSPAVSHRALLSQIMNIRESSSSADSCDDNDCSLSETDDNKIPIEVMLGGTTFFSADDSKSSHGK